MRLPWNHAIVIGASSGIGAELTRQLAAGGCQTAAVARRSDLLEALAQGNDRIHPYVHDVTAYGEVPALLQRICQDLGGLDLVIYAAGVMPRVQEHEYPFAADKQTIEVNLLGAIAWLNEVAQRFERARGGTIVGISSTAGDRGRRPYPVYCTSKAAFTAYLEALRNRMARYGVKVVTAKPGPVRTPMTDGMGRLPLMISADEAARQILAGAARGTASFYVPRTWQPIMLVLRALPSVIFRRLNI
jgi:decaprenylphospho-beta-D-erythro-pentofuranosid-2-ulose 2-reductase